MTTPMFIREPIIGNSGGYITGESCVDFNDPATWVWLTSEVLEATLIESIKYVAYEDNTDAGKLLIVVLDPDYPATEMPVLSADIPAGAAAQMASGSIAVDVVLPVGWKIGVAHDIRSNGGGAFTGLAVTAHGGILR